jgi:L-ascorbate metabolism protein UlaG (beta-lactamase superfamily)
MEITYLGHAAVLLEARGRRVLMDPWLSDPTYHGTWWHYPPLVLGVRDLPPIDYLYISHEHPDHFDPPTLVHLDRHVHVLIANYRRKRFRDRIAALGFRRITEIDFGEAFPCGDGLRVQLIAPDRPWDDSAILVQDGTTTVLNVNDCHLDDSTLARLGREHRIDLAFLTFTGASQYPGCFEFPLASKIRRWRESKRAHLEEFVNWAKLLRARRAVPAAGNYALLAADQWHLNTPYYVNTPAEAVAALTAAAPEIEALQMNPGDRWSPAGGLQRRHPAPDWSRRMEDIERLGREHAGQIAEYFAGEAEAPPDLFERFRAYFSGLLSADASIAKRVNIVSWWAVDGPAGGDWVIDFTRERDWVSRGAPSQWNLRLHIPDKLVHLGVSGQSSWDDLVLSFRVRLARNPDRYNKEFWTWISKL